MPNDGPCPPNDGPCPPPVALDPPSDPNAIHITESVIAKPLPEGYWAQAFPYKCTDNHPDLIGYGLGFQGKPATVRLYKNPLNESESKSGDWKVSDIAYLEYPVAMSCADLTGNGYNDVIICDRYGPSMDNLWEPGPEKDGGRIQWLRNPGDRASSAFWEAQRIGNITGMHRLQACHFTTSSVVQVLALPIILKSSDLTSPTPIVVFTPQYLDIDDKSPGPKSWESDTAYPSQFRLIHEARVLPKANGDLDMVLVAGKEGIVLIWYDVDENSYEYNIVGTGIPDPRDDKVKYWGSGCIEVCRVGDDEVGYLATCEAFHGNIVAVYTKSADAPKGYESLKNGAYWTRHVIDDYGPLHPLSQTGTLHHVAAISLPGEKTDSFAIACIGAPIGTPACQGVYMYKPIDLKNLSFEKIKITGESAARLAVSTLCTEHPLDIASISYYVSGYHTGSAPAAMRINSLRPSNTLITATKLDKEILIRVPRPSALAANQVSALPFWDLAGKRLSLIILPPGATTSLGFKVYAVKVIYGQLTVDDLHSRKRVVRGVAPPAHATHDTSIIPFTNVTAGDQGAVFVSVQSHGEQPDGPFKSMDDVFTENNLPDQEGISAEARGLDIPFVRVDRTDWGISGGLWNKFQFYNATGFHVYFNDDAMEKIVHIQAWTLGIGETARFHNHTDKSFCEIHYCLTNGGGTAGMRYFEDDYTEPIDVKKELTKEYVEKNSTLLVVPDMHEHGPLWRIKEGTQATPIIRDDDTVSYPWHAWLASDFGDYDLPIEPPLQEDVQRFDVWMAFEFPSSAFQY